jgi:hypothetical protein
MAIITNGLSGPFKGKSGGLVYYVRNGKNVVRKQTDSTKERSIAQKANNQKMSLTTKFLTPVLEFVNLGFKEFNKDEGNTAYNRATSEVKLNGLTGTYPDIALNFERIMLSKGTLKMAEAVSLAIVSNGIEFKWAVDPDESWPESADQAMLLIYFPETKKALSVLYSSLRAAGSGILPVSTPMLGKQMHAYISFISADRENVSDSVYAGALNL